MTPCFSPAPLWVCGQCNAMLFFFSLWGGADPGILKRVCAIAQYLARGRSRRGILGGQNPPPPPLLVDPSKRGGKNVARRVLVLNGNPDPPFPKSCIRPSWPCPQGTNLDQNTLMHLGHMHFSRPSLDLTSILLPLSGSKGLVTNYGDGGGATKREGGGHVKFYPYEKGGQTKF